MCELRFELLKELNSTVEFLFPPCLPYPSDVLHGSVGFSSAMTASVTTLCYSVRMNSVKPASFWGRGGGVPSGFTSPVYIML